jgi:hypothetical protein
MDHYRHFVDYGGSIRMVVPVSKGCLTVKVGFPLGAPFKPSFVLSGTVPLLDRAQKAKKLMW